MRPYFSREHDYVFLIWELIDRNTVDDTKRKQDYANPIARDPLHFRECCGCRTEISSDRPRNVLLLPYHLSETRGARRREAILAFGQPCFNRGSVIKDIIIYREASLGQLGLIGTAVLVVSER